MQVDCTDPRNADRCPQPNFPSPDRIVAETQKLVREIANPRVSPAEEDEQKRTIIAVVFGTIFTIIGFATALQVSGLFATLFPAGDILVTVIVVLVAIGLSIVIGIIEVRISRAVLKTRYFNGVVQPRAPKETDPVVVAEGAKIRALYNKAHRICVQADLTTSPDQTLVEGSFALNLRNVCTEEVFHALVRKSDIGSDPVRTVIPARKAPLKRSKGEPSLKEALIAELKEAQRQRGGPVDGKISGTSYV